MLALTETKYEPSKLVENLKQDGLEFGPITNKELLPAVDSLADSVIRGGWLGWLLTGEAPAAVCLANRKPGLRAAAAGSVKDVKSAQRSAATNLIVTDPAEKSFWELLQIGRAIARGPARECPAWLKD